MSNLVELVLRGSSDDILVWELDGSADEVYPPTSDEHHYCGSVLVHSDRGRARVHIIYDGCWSFALTKVDEEDGDLFPHGRGWEGYSEVLKLKVPRGTKVSPEWKS